ncbi:MAG TPA: sugar ABC transporter permease [Tepidisphaeraceae bacterium]|jgi:ABC-type sugar transport system permease subunit|nr:sugar ABC transporter permease [Tepidisphaeraceae bacterium]
MSNPTLTPTATIPQTAGIAAATAVVPKQQRRTGGGWRWKVRVTPYLFLLPYVLTTLVFFLYPLLHATVLAFFQTSGPGRRVFVGTENFTFVLADPDFRKALFNTCLFAVASIAVQLPLSLGLAMLLNAKHGRMKAFFRLAIFAPNLVGQVFVGILFAMLFTPRYGLFNRFLHELIGWGLEMRWLGDPALVMPAVVIASLWLYVGFNMIYFLAALQNVDQSLVEAARIDGADPWDIFLNVTLPSIAPVVTFVVVTSTIGSFQLFELPYTLLQGFGPNNSGLTVVGYLYNYAFDSGDLGTAAAVGWLLTFVILMVSLAQIRLSRKVSDD